MPNVAILYCGSTLSKSLFDKLLWLKLSPFMMQSNTPLEEILSINPIAIIITGSPDYVNAPNASMVDLGIYDCGVPVLGICYGMQRMAVDLGGEVKRLSEPELEWVEMDLTGDESTLFRDFTEEGVPTWMLHTCKLTKAPPGFTITGFTDRTEIAAMENTERDLYAVQFHPEHKGHDPTDQAGTAVLWNFLNGICNYEI